MQLWQPYLSLLCERKWEQEQVFNWKVRSVKFCVCVCFFFWLVPLLQVCVCSAYGYKCTMTSRYSVYCGVFLWHYSNLCVAWQWQPSVVNTITKVQSVGGQCVVSLSPCWSWTGGSSLGPQLDHKLPKQSELWLYVRYHMLRGNTISGASFSIREKRVYSWDSEVFTKAPNSGIARGRLQFNVVFSVLLTFPFQGTRAHASSLEIEWHCMKEI